MEKIIKTIDHIKCVIVANGSFPQSNIIIDYIRNADYICCCDGAIEQLTRVGITPNAIIGDGDSISEQLRSRYASIFIKIDEQETNDLTKATIHCAELGYHDIMYVGATGKREDHTIGNIFLLPYYYERFNTRGIMISDCGFFSIHSGSNKICSFAGEQVSIFNVNCTRLSSQGLKWDAYPFAQLWQGTLNEALGDYFTIDGDGIYMVYHNFTPLVIPSKD